MGAWKFECSKWACFCLYLARHSVSLVPKNDFPPDKYALEIAGKYYYKFLVVD